MDIKIFNLVAAGCVMVLGVARRDICLTVSGCTLFLCATYNFIDR